MKSYLQLFFQFQKGLHSSDHISDLPASSRVHERVYETAAGAQMSCRTMKIPLNGAHLHFLESFLHCTEPHDKTMCETRALACSAITELNDKGISSGRRGEMKILSRLGGFRGRRRFEKSWR